jgi:ABC-type transport system substrate-binding protein
MILMTFFDYSYQVSILSEGDFGNKQIINADARTTGYDSDRARGLLLEAGYENGFDLVLVISSDQEYLIKSADRISQYFREIGIAAEVMVLDSATIYDQIRTMAAAGVPSILYYDN